MESYIVRINHRNGKDPMKVAGVVEAIGKEGRKGFLGRDSLWRILTTPWRGSGPGRRSLRAGKTPLDDRWDAMTFTEILREIHQEEE